MKSKLVRLHIRIFGDVQGVFFRVETQNHARAIDGVTGFVRNVEDGSVEVLAEGEKKKLEKLLDWCRHGPVGAGVEKVEEEWMEYRGEFESFDVSY